MGIILTIIIGFVAGVIAKLVTPGSNEPSGFILTTVLGIVGAFVASWLGQALGWYGPGEGAGLIGAVVGAIIVLLIWGAVMRQRTPDRILIAILIPAMAKAERRPPFLLPTVRFGPMATY